MQDEMKKTANPVQIGIYPIIIFVNILFTYLAISDPLRTINSDGVLYLQTAQAYLQGGWSAAMHVYPWPFYSVLIAWVSQIAHCSLKFSAHFINLVLQILTCLGFFNLACKVKDSNQSLFMILTTLVILLYPAFNHERDLIIRDFGYWAFSLWGWFYLIRLNEKASFSEGLKFNVSMLLASLFRLEGIVMLLFAPLALFFTKEKSIAQRMNVFLKAYALTFGLGLGALIYVWIVGKIDTFGRLIELKAQLYSGVGLIVDQFSQAKQNMVNYVLTPVSIASVLPLLIGGLIGVYIKTLITTLTPFYTILIGTFSCKGEVSPTASAKPIFYTAIFLNLLITIIFLMQAFFLAERYMFGLCFLLLILAPSALLWIYQQTRSEKNWLFWAVILIMVSIGLVSLHNFGPSKIYLKEAGSWMHENLPPTASIYTNNPQLNFYINRPLMTRQSIVSQANIQNVIQNAKVQKYDYLVFQIHANDVVFKKQLNQLLPKPVKVFANQKGDAVWVFDLNQRS